MKNLSALFTASALTTVSALSQAAIIPITADGVSLVSGKTRASNVSEGVGTLNDSTGTLTWSTTAIVRKFIGAMIGDDLNTGSLATNDYISTDYVLQITGVPDAYGNAPATFTRTTTACTELGGAFFTDCSNQYTINETVDMTSSLVGGVVNIGQTITWESNYTQGAGAVNLYDTFTISTVPVPAAAWLFGSALMGLAGLKRKR